MSAHSAGPWTLRYQEANPLLGWDRRPEQIVDASGRQVRVSCVALSSGPECDANAVLIAVAPSMLDELRRAAGIFRDYEALHRAKSTVEGAHKADANALHAERIERLVAKAEGR